MREIDRRIALPLIDVLSGRINGLAHPCHFRENLSPSFRFVSGKGKFALVGSGTVT